MSSVASSVGLEIRVASIGCCYHAYILWCYRWRRTVVLLSPHSRHLANGVGCITHQLKRYCKRTSIRSLRPAIPETLISTMMIRNIDWVSGHGGFQHVSTLFPRKRQRLSSELFGGAQVAISYISESSQPLLPDLNSVSHDAFVKHRLCFRHRTSLSPSTRVQKTA